MADGYKSVGDDDPQYVPPDDTATGKTDKESEQTSSVGDSPVPGNEQQGGFSYDSFPGSAPVQPQQPGPVPGSYQSVPQTQPIPQEPSAYQPYQQPFSQPAYGYGQPAAQPQSGVTPPPFGQPSDTPSSFQPQQPGIQPVSYGSGQDTAPGANTPYNPFGIPPYAGDATPSQFSSPQQPQYQPTLPVQGLPVDGQPAAPAGDQPSPVQDGGQQSFAPPTSQTPDDDSSSTESGTQPDPGFAPGPVPTSSPQAPGDSQTPGNPQMPGMAPPNVPPAAGQPPFGQPPYGGYQQPGQPPQGQPPYGAPMPPAPKKSNKKLVVGLSIAGGIAALVVIVLVVLAFLPSGKPTAEDYTNALNQTSKISNRYYSVNTKLGDVYSVTYDPSKSLDDKDIASLKQKVKDYQSAVSDLGSQDKILKDENVKTKYDAYVKASDKYASYINGLADSALPMSKAMKACSDTPSASLYDSDFYDKYNQYITDCTASLDELSKAKDADVAKYGTDMKDYIGKLSELIGKMQALGNPNDLQYGTDQYNQLNDLQDEYYDLSSDGYDIDSDFSDALKETEDKMNPEDELNDLNDVLQDGFHDALSNR